MTIVYEVVNRCVDLEHAVALVAYMKHGHHDDMLNTGCFYQSEFEQSEPTVFRSRYYATSEEEIKKYLELHAAKMRSEFQQHFPDGIVCERTNWTQSTMKDSEMKSLTLVVELDRSSPPIQALLIQLPSRVFVRYEPRNRGDEDSLDDYEDSNSTDSEPSKLTIKLTGSSMPLLNSIHVGSTPWHGKNRALNLTLTDPAYYGESLLVDIAWPFPHALNFIGSSAETVVDAKMLANRTTSHVELHAHNSSLFVESSRPMTVNSLALESFGDGLIQVVVPSIKASTGIELKAAGGMATVALVADQTIADSLRTTALNAGNVFLSTNDASIRKISTTMAGDGIVSYNDHGRCNYQDVSMLGGGKVYAAAFRCDDTSLYSMGSGHVVINGGHSLEATHIGIGKLSYLHGPPDIITHIGFAPRYGMHEYDDPSNIPKWTLVALPEYAPKRVDQVGHLISMTSVNSGYEMHNMGALVVMAMLVVASLALWTYIRRRPYIRMP